MIARWLCSRTHGWWRGPEESAIEPPRSAVVDVLDGGGLTELGGGQAARETAVVAKGGFAIDEQAEPVGMRHLGGLRIVVQLDERVRHGGETEGRADVRRWDE